MKSRKTARFRRLNGEKESAEWRALPATAAQWAVLRRVGRETGVRFPESMTRGDASEVIGARFAADPSASRASRRAHRRRAVQRRAASGKTLRAS